MIQPFILSAIVAFILWCVTDTSLKPEHVWNRREKITFWRVLSVLLAQIVLWTLVGLFAAWILPHLPDFFLTGWKFSATLFASSVLQWFALFMILQYVWMIVRSTLSTALVATLAGLGSRRAKRVLDDAFRQWQFTEMKRRAGVEHKQSGDVGGK